MSTPDRTPTDLEHVRERLNVVTRRRGSPSCRTSSVIPRTADVEGTGLRESSKSRTTIRQHLQQLIEAGIVEEVTLPTERRRNDLPYKFYGISEEGRQFLEAHDLLRAEETLRDVYARVEKTDEIERYETAPRPERWVRVEDAASPYRLFLPCIARPSAAGATREHDPDDPEDESADSEDGGEFQ